MFDQLTAEQREALERIVFDWISEGFTTPPYEPAYYDIFEALRMAKDRPWSYDTRRPSASDEKFYPRFTTLDTTAHETGTIHMVNVPDDLLAERDPRSLQGETVLLDGVLVQVEGVETHAVVWYPGNMRLKTIGLLVVPGT